jgi:hypothetical protein
VTRNPWTGLAARPPYVLEEDRPYVKAWNDTVGAERADLRLAVELLPDPFVGPRDAPLVILGLNPGFAGPELVEHRSRRFRDAVRSNLSDRRAHIHFYLTEPFAETAGGRWWRRCLRTLLKEGWTYEELARRVLAIEFHGYHSQNWTTLPVTLPSQWYSFDLLVRAMDRGAIIVVARGRRQWEVAVPQLRRYRRAFGTNTVRSTFMSPGNLPRGAFNQLLRAIQG